MKSVLQILVIEDSEDDAFLVLRQIEKGGYEVEYKRVDTAEKMKVALVEKTWDIILSDYHLPHLNGLEALKLFKESGIDVPFIIISGTIGEEIAVEAMKAGAHDYIMKNNMQRLIPAVERELREAKNRAERKLLERKQIEAEAIRISEEKYRYIFDNISDGIFLLEVTEDCRFRNLEMNSSLANLTGIDRNYMIGKFQEEVVPEETANVVNAKYRHCVESGYLIEEELEMELPLGKRIFLSTLIPLRNETGRIHRIVGITRDITQRRKEEEERIKLSTAIEHCPVSIVITDSKGVIEYANPFCTNNTGYKHNELIGRASRIFKSGLTPIEVYKELWVTISSGNIWRGEICNKKKNGELYWEKTSISPIINKEGRITHYIGIKEDITKRKRALEALKESEKRYRQLVEMSPDSIAIHQQGKIVYINTAGAKLFGAQTLQELIGKSILDLVHPDYRNIAIQRVEKTLSGENTPYIEEKFIKLDETPIDVEVTAISSFYQGKAATQVVVRDITERKKNEAEIKLKNEELFKLNAEKDKFFSIIAHDLRSPFNGFLGLTEIMAEKLPSLPMAQIQRFAVDMRDSAANLFRLLENLLQWARIQEGLIPFRPELIHLFPIINESIEMIMYAAKNKEIEITSHIPDNVTVFADSNMLQTVIRNLLSNAVKFTPKGGNISITAKATADKSIEISVKDTGIGMNNTMIGNLFRIDVRTNRPGTDEEPSSGLGLLLCKDFIEKHGGKIWAESEEGKGTTFYFSIPATR